MKTIFTLCFCAASLLTGAAQEESYFSNPVIRGDVPDPSVMRVGERYYVTGTSSEWAPHYPIFRSDDLVNWQPVGHVFAEKPAWTKSSFWAPEWYQHKGKTYVYYTARKQSDNISCIGVAVADSPEGPFKDYGPIVEFGSEAIDAFILEDAGNLYISWKAYGLDNRPIELLACKLTDDGLHLDGEPFTLLRDDERQGMEGQHWLKRDGYYYLIYSVRGCCGPRSDYAVSVARSKRLKGPYEKYAGNPILHGSREVLSIGHGTIVDTTADRLYYLCHAYLPGENFYQGRQPFLQELRFGEDHWPHFVTGEYATLSQPAPFVESVQEPGGMADFSDDFAASALRPEWSWNYPYSDVKAELKVGKLLLSGIPKPGVKSGSALCLRPASADYTIETAVNNRNASWKGIVFYGDDNNLITLGCVGDRLTLKCLLEGESHRLADMPLPAATLYLRMRVSEGTKSRFFWSKDGKQWHEIAAEGLSNEEAQKLVQWDRISRPGLYHEGASGEPARFEYCLMRNE